MRRKQDKNKQPTRVSLQAESQPQFDLHTALERRLHPILFPSRYGLSYSFTSPSPLAKGKGQRDINPQGVEQGPASLQAHTEWGGGKNKSLLDIKMLMTLKSSSPASLPELQTWFPTPYWKFPLRYSTFLSDLTCQKFISYIPSSLAPLPYLGEA